MKSVTFASIMNNVHRNSTDLNRNWLIEHIYKRIFSFFAGKFLITLDTSKIIIIKYFQSNWFIPKRNELDNLRACA